MRKVICLLILITGFVSSPAQDSNYKPGEAIVMLRNSSIDQLTSSLIANGVSVRRYKLLSISMNTWLIDYDEQVNQDEIISKLRRSPLVQIAQSNHYIQLRSKVPDDPDFTTQWNMDNTGQLGGVINADIKATQAWDITTGGLTSQGDTIVVAVIDEGFDIKHADLSFWKNYREIPNNNIDDDGNGYIDDYNGWNSILLNDSVSSGVITTEEHGTHVSGIVGAKGNNSLGVTGVNWNVKVMPVVGADTLESAVVAAYAYVLDQRKLYNKTNGASGTFVVCTNSSFGVNYGKPVNYPLWCAFYDSLGSAGILSAAATTNGNINVDSLGDIPTTCVSNFLIAVTNTNNKDQKSTTAGYGLHSIDLGAPGTAILSTYPNNGYIKLTGTSMASPHVAGSIALMWSAACPKMIDDYKADPPGLALMMKNFLLSGTQAISAMNGITVTGGRLDVFAAIQQVQTYNCTTNTGISPITKLSIHNIYPNPTNTQAEIEYNSGGALVVTLSIYDLLGQKIYSTVKEANGGITKQLIDVSSLSKGVYCVVLSADNNKSDSQRLVIY